MAVLIPTTACPCGTWRNLTPKRSPSLASPLQRSETTDQRPGRLSQSRPQANSRHPCVSVVRADPAVIASAPVTGVVVIVVIVVIPSPDEDAVVAVVMVVMVPSAHPVTGVAGVAVRAAATPTARRTAAPTPGNAAAETASSATAHRTCPAPPRGNRGRGSCCGHDANGADSHQTTDTDDNRRQRPPTCFSCTLSLHRGSSLTPVLALRQTSIGT